MLRNPLDYTHLPHVKKNKDSKGQYGGVFALARVPSVPLSTYKESLTAKSPHHSDVNDPFE